MESVVMSFNVTHLASLSNIIFIERYSTIECFIYVYVYIHREIEKVCKSSR